ncbi:AAA family ATPase [Desulfonema magnum]|uniref:Cytidylate kinase-like family protein n=1 Tax=Desulfonema magnum TaxID=45655 RepID=A0A975BYP2_9BACT|nr:cytidylate kinase-like family protein [Desulfonema magnum]QTA93429.1 Cytidylate kinase-like family protein [Desulfonema magnum]
MSIITISRQFGAGGKTLGKMISEKLGYSLVDNEIIQMVAEKAKVSSQWVESIEKEAGGKFLKFISGVVPKSLVDRVLDEKRGYIDEEIYVDSLHKIISRLADAGNVVIIGRGGQYVLKEREDTFHLLLIGEKEDRVKFMEEHYDLTSKQALQAVEMDDKRRINLYRKFGKKDYDHPDLYHIVLNMSKVDLETARDMVCRLVKP